MMRRVAAALAVILFAAGGYGYWRYGHGPADLPEADVAVTEPVLPPEELNALAQPRAELTAEQLAGFEAGRNLFVEKVPGLGPLFNAQSCVECHARPTIGGSGDLAHAAVVAPAASSKPEAEPYRKFALPGWTVPEHPRNVSRRIPPPLYGLGLIEQIPDDTIRGACGKGHPNSAKDGGSLPKNAVARFGIKPHVGTVPDFVDAALLMENSVTTPIDAATDDDNLPDPEVDRAFVETLAAYIRGLPPPGRHGNDEAGEAAFRAFGCGSCHVQHMPPAHDVFSDFCIHPMGDELADGIFDHEAKGDEFRTTPLWGLRFRRRYLHDGRATTLHAAIVAHGGEAAPAATAYSQAPDDQRTALLRFLDTL